MIDSINKEAFQLRGVLKIRFFVSNKILKAEFSIVNEHFKIEVQQ